MNGHAVALWAGIVSFFGGLLAIGAIDIFSLSGVAEFAASIIVALVTAFGVYAKQRLDDAKRVDEAKRLAAAKEAG